jgi:recombinational DNA repair protein (RecF pathway)
LTDIELLIRVFETGMVRRNGIRCDMSMCARVAEKLKELQKRMEADEKH